MNSTLIKRMQGLWVVLVVVLVAGAAGATTASAASPSAQVSALTAKQKRAKAKELKKCKKQRNAQKRKACIKKVNRKYAKLAATGKTVVVDVEDNWYTPALVNLKVNDSIKWDWRYSVGSEGHNVSLMSGPIGVSPFDFESPIFKGPDATFKRTFKKAGSYSLFCTLHAEMTMDVKVSK